MKKLFVIVALIAFGFAANAQSLNVSSAYEAQNRGYLKKAKGYIDQAAVHEQTKADPAMWFYRTMIYCKIGEAIAPDSKHKEKAALQQTSSDWYRTAFESVLAWQQFDKEREYSGKIKPFFGVIGNAYTSMAIDAMNDNHDYKTAVALCDTAIIMFNVYGDDAYTNQAYYIAGLAAANMQDNESVKKYFQPLQKNGYKDPKSAQQVYETLFSAHFASHDTINAVKTAKAYLTNCPNDFHADILLATAYALNHNNEKSIEFINNALSKVGDNLQTKAEVLCRAAKMYEMNNDYESAEQRYKESLEIVPVQYEANYGLAGIFFNKAADKIDAADKVPLEDESGLYDKLIDESKELFRASIPYFQGSINYLDSLPEDQKAFNRKKLYDSLNYLGTAYSRLGMTAESESVRARVASFQN